MFMKWLLVVWLLTPLSAWGCDCIPTSLSANVQQMPNIAVGKVIKLLDTDQDRQNYFWSRPDHAYRILFQIEESFKGLSSHQIVEIDSDFNNCAFYFKQDARYLLFFEKWKGKLIAHICSYSGRLDDAKTQTSLRYLRQYSSSVKLKD